MSNKASASPSPSPSPPPSERPQEDAKEKVEEAESSRRKGEAPEKGRDVQGSESQESTSEPSKSPSSERDGESAALSSNETTPPGPSSSAAAEQAGSAVPAVSNAFVQGDWQAIWSPQHNMYYFHNLRTNETTWTNPIAPSDTSAGASSSASTRISPQEIAAAQGIDPELAYLDPTLAAGPSVPTPFSYTAKFNARTGAFAKQDARTPEHISEYERMKRMSNFYFDMDAWQQEVEQRQEEEEASGKKRKKPTKKDLEMFKERKKQKKLAKTAWLRT